MEEAQKYLLEEPVTTVEYVKYLEYLEESAAKADAMEERLDYCKELYDIMEEFSMPIPPDDMTNYLELSVTMGSFRNLVDKKQEETTAIIKTFTEQLNKDISRLIAEMGEIKDECIVRKDFLRFTKLYRVLF